MTFIVTIFISLDDIKDKNNAQKNFSSAVLINHSNRQAALKFKSVDSDLNSYDNSIHLYKTLSNKQPINPHVIDDYYRDLTERIKFRNDQATMIVPPFLYLGGHRSIKDLKSLYNQGITHVLNMARELQFDLQHLNMLPHIKVMSINAHDTQEYNIRGDFQKAFDFIDDAFVNNGRYYIFIKVFFFAYDIFILQNLIRRIIVNCARGISRSATIVIAYLMYKFKMRYDDAFELLIKLRPQVRPNSNFRYQLKLYEKELISNRYYNTNLTSIVATSTIKKK